MADVNTYLRENLAGVSKNVVVSPNIPDKKLNNAVVSFGYSGNVHNVIALFDNTVFGSGKDGLLFTGEQVIYRAAFSDPVCFSFSSISSVECRETIAGSKGDKVKSILSIADAEGKRVDITALLECDYKKLAEVLKYVTENFTEFKEERQFIALEGMGESLKVAYVKVIVNMAYDNDQIVDEKEFAEILLLMTRLNLSSESRFSLRAYIASGSNLSPTEQLIDELNAHTPEAQQKSVHVSLAKDLLNVFLATGGSSIEDFAFFKKNRSLLKVRDDEVELVMMAIKNDHNMLKEDYSDDQIVSALKELSAKAAAIGTPLAAVYLTGSVIGLSAAGLSSGLAALGMGGMLGFSSMATGIGVAVLLGVGVYKGVRKLTGVDEISRSKRRELMLNEVIRQTQSTISLLMEDVNYITLKLNEALKSVGEQGVKIQKLMQLMAQMTAAGSVLTQKASAAQSSAAKLRCAMYLDEPKLKLLTREPTKQEVYGFILGFYEEKSFFEEVNGERRDVSKLAIKTGLQQKDLENLGKAFEAIGYFSMGDVLKGTAGDMADKAKEKLVGLFK